MLTIINSDMANEEKTSKIQKCFILQVSFFLLKFFGLALLEQVFLESLLLPL